MLIKAKAAGFDIGSIVAGLNQPLGIVRSPLLIQMALELAGEVRGLGNAVLAAIEKGEASSSPLSARATRSRCRRSRRPSASCRCSRRRRRRTAC